MRSGAPDPTANDAFADLLVGVRKNRRAARAYAGVSREHYFALLDACRQTPWGICERAFIALCYAGPLMVHQALRLNVSDVTFLPDGLQVRGVRADGPLFVGRARDAAYDPVLAVLRHVHQLPRRAPLFPAYHYQRWMNKPMTHAAVCQHFRQCVRRAGLPPRTYTPHSLFIGFLRAAAENDLPPLTAMMQSGINDYECVKRYYRRYRSNRRYAATHYTGL